MGTKRDKNTRDSRLHMDQSRLKLEKFDIRSPLVVEIAVRIILTIIC